MLLKKIQLLLLILIVFSACELDDSVEFESSTASTQYSVSSQLDNGFSFETMKVINDSSDLISSSDFIVFPQLGEKGELLSPFLVQPLLKSSYALAKQFSNLDDAKKYYDTYNTVSDSGLKFENTAIPVQPFQLWIVKTNTNQYGKILISGTSSSDKANLPVAVVDFYAKSIK